MGILGDSGGFIIIGKAAIFIVLGFFLGFILKYLLRKTLDKYVIKKIFYHDQSTYDTAKILNKIFTEIIQWVIIILFVDYSLGILGFNISNQITQYIFSNIANIVIFLLILSTGLLISKIIASRIRNTELEHKEEGIYLIEFLITASFFLTAIEFIGIKATALMEFYKVMLYVIGAIIVIAISKYIIFSKEKNKKKKSKKRK